MTSTLTQPHRRIHPHPLGLSILRAQLHDGDVMVELDGARVVRMRTEHRKSVPSSTAPRTVPMPRVPVDEPATDVIPVVFPTIDPPTSRLILGMRFRHEMPALR